MLPFRDAERHFGALTAASVAALAMVAGELVLVLDSAGMILDVSATALGLVDVADWIGRQWADTVTLESRPKIEEMLIAGAVAADARWRQVNHRIEGGELPIRYRVLELPGGNTRLAIGRDMRDAASLQQRLLRAQQSLERDYLRLRQAEARYRLLFELSDEPMLIVEARSQRVREANPAARGLLRPASASPVGQPLTALFAAEAREPLLAYLGAAAVNDRANPIEVRVVDGAEPVRITASSFRQHDALYHLVRLSDAGNGAQGIGPAPLAEILQHLPDAFVLADSHLAIVTANTAFIDLVQAASLDQIRGKPLSRFIGRAGIDLPLIQSQLAEHGMARNVATVINTLDGMTEPVELSAVGGDAVHGHLGLSLRHVGRRLRDLPPVPSDAPRSVEQLTELVGRMSLKDIVRESTDLIERLCIEAALGITSNNRASAAEILGLSRQSLYTKLHRHGLGNLGDSGDSDA